MNTKTILFGTLAATAAASNLALKVNVDDAYDLFVDGNMVANRANSWNSNQDYNVEVAQGGDHLLAITAIDFGGGIRVSVEVNGVGTKMEDWRCTGENIVARDAVDYSYAALDFIEDDSWLVAGNANSASVNGGEAFWATGYGQQSTIKCRYHGNLLDSYSVEAYDGTEEHAALTEQLNQAQYENQHHRNAADDIEQLIAAIYEDHQHSKDQLDAVNQQLGDTIQDLNNQVQQAHDDIAAAGLANSEAAQSLIDALEADLAQTRHDFEEAVNAQNILIQQGENANHEAAVGCQLNANGDSHQICTRVWVNETW